VVVELVVLCRRCLGDRVACQSAVSRVVVTAGRAWARVRSVRWWWVSALAVGLRAVDRCPSGLCVFTLSLGYVLPMGLCVVLEVPLVWHPRSGAAPLLGVDACPVLVVAGDDLPVG